MMYIIMNMGNARMTYIVKQREYCDAGDQFFIKPSQTARVKDEHPWQHHIKGISSDAMLFNNGDHQKELKYSPC